MEILKHTSLKTEAHLIRHEYNQNFTRDTVTGLGGSGGTREFPLFAVLGRLETSARTVTAAKTGTGNGTITGATAAAGTKLGDWVATMLEPATNLGAFSLEDPDGKTVGIITVGTPFSINGLAGTIADGSTDWGSDARVVYSVAADANAAKYKPVDATATDGTQNAAAINLVKATAADGVDISLDVLRRGPLIIVEDEVVWPSGATAAQKTIWTKQLADRNILLRS